MPGVRRFDDTAVLVTGAASGIGRAAAQRLAEEGATLALSDVDADGLASVVATCADAGAKVASMVCDVADEASVIEMVGAAASEMGRIDAVCNVAGILAFE